MVSRLCFLLVLLAAPTACAQAPGRTTVWRVVADVPLPGRAGRFDYQSFDTTGRLWIAHMGAGEVLAFDVHTRQVVARVPGMPGVTGVLVVPSIGRVFAALSGSGQVAVLDAQTARVLERIPGGRFPDGLAFAPEVRKLFVSDEFGRREIVIDASTNRRRATIPLGGEAGNTQYDSVGRQIVVAVQTRNELVTIDPESERITGRYQLPGADHPHGVLIDAPRRLGFIANEGNGKLLVIDLRTMRVTSEYAVGSKPDVLAFDPRLQRLYVASESGVVTAFSELAGRLKVLGTYTAPGAHSVAVNPVTHEVYLPLATIGGRPVLRILVPADSLRQ
jgi:DNA-binding beta-propeller fold protein YncE